MNEQLKEWTGEFGDEYTKRNNDLSTLPARIGMFQQCVRSMQKADRMSFLEIGANVGLNGLALRSVVKDLVYTGHEPNEEARKQLINRALPSRLGYVENLTNISDNSLYCVFTCGVLIHTRPESVLFSLCSEINRISMRYILCIEYFSEELQEVQYRGKDNMLWKQDYGRYWLENFSVRHVDHGFFWKPATGLDNLTWWLMEKV